MDLTRLTLIIAAAVILSYVAFVWYDCTRDESCHVDYCGARHTPCGLARKRVDGP